MTRWSDGPKHSHVVTNSNWWNARRDAGMIPQKTNEQLRAEDRQKLAGPLTPAEQKKNDAVVAAEKAKRQEAHKKRMERQKR